MESLALIGSGPPEAGEVGSEVGSDGCSEPRSSSKKS